MELGIRLTSGEVEDSKLATLTRDFAQGLRSNRVGEVRLRSEESLPGKKGDLITIGNIVLTLIGSGGVAVSLIQVLKSFVERKSSLHFELTQADGRKMEITAENLDHKNLEQTARTMDAFLKG